MKENDQGSMQKGMARMNTELWLTQKLKESQITNKKLSFTNQRGENLTSNEEDIENDDSSAGRLTSVHFRETNLKYAFDQMISDMGIDNITMHNLVTLKKVQYRLN
jgi:hypothetical protein